MNRYRKIWIAVVLAILMTCLLSGCGQRPGPGEIMKKMSDAVNRQENFGIDASICQQMDGEAENTTDSQVEVRILRQPMDRSAQYYVKLNGEWIRRAGAAGAADMDRNLKKLFVDYRDMMHLSEEDRMVDGRSCYDLTSVMIPLDLVALLQDAANQLKDAGVPEIVWTDDILDDINAQMELMVDVDTYLPAAMSIGIYKNDRSAVTMDYTFGFPGTMELKIPEEALHVPEPEPETETEAVPEELPGLYAAPEDAEVLVEFGEREYALYENDQVKVYMMRVMRTADDALIADLSLVNTTNTEIDVFTESVAVNHRMFHTTNLFQHVRGGDEVLGTIRIDGLTDAAIEDIGALSLQIGAARSVDGQEILESRVNTLVLYHGKERYELPEGEDMQILFEDSDLRVTAGAFLREEEQLRIPLYLENLGEETCSLTLDNMKGPMGNLPNLRIFGEVQPASLLYAELVIPADSPLAGVDGGELIFRAIGRDLRSMAVLFNQDEIHLVIPSVETMEESIHNDSPMEETTEETMAELPDQPESAPETESASETESQTEEVPSEEPTTKS